MRPHSRTLPLVACPLRCQVDDTNGPVEWVGEALSAIFVDLIQLMTDESRQHSNRHVQCDMRHAIHDESGRRDGCLAVCPLPSCQALLATSFSRVERVARPWIPHVRRKSVIGSPRPTLLYVKRSQLEVGGTSPSTKRRWTDTHPNVESYTNLELVRDEVRGVHALTGSFAVLFVASPQSFLIQFPRTKSEGDQVILEIIHVSSTVLSG
jgi:hypothetical protein